MSIPVNSIVLFVALVSTHPATPADLMERGPIASWRFDEGKGHVTIEEVSKKEDALKGYLKYDRGVRGACLKFDGFTTQVVRRAAHAPKLGDAFTVEAWIAPQEYSWNWTGIVDREQDGKAGYSFGINHVGQIGLYAAVDGEWQGCLTQESVPLLKWSHVAGTYDSRTGFAIFINGRPVGRLAAEGKMTPARGLDFFIGMAHRKQYPAGTERGPSKQFLSKMVFDGLIDEVTVYDRALPPAEIKQSYDSIQPHPRQPLQYRVMPSGPSGPGRFGAYYTKLEYCPEWDRLWRVADHPDVLVRFDDTPVRMVFWRGTGYCPAWVTENGKWVGDQGPESWNRWGCCEQMSDKQCRYAHVRIIENSDARVVVHWRTASPDITYGFNHVNEDTGWGEWTDEYYTIYPDAVAVRYQEVHSDWAERMEFQQSEILNQPGTKPQDNVELDAITLVNMEGQTQTYSWAKGYPFKGRAPEPAHANIQVINLRAKNRHFVIGEPGAYWTILRFGTKEGYSTMPCWNHWPVAQLPNDGRVTPAPDRPSSTCLGTLFPVKHKAGEFTMTAVNLYGMTEKPAKELAVLARSWNFAADLAFVSEAFENSGYQKNQRAYLLSAKEAGKPAKLEITLEGNHNSPILNPAFVIKNWGDADAKLTVNGKPIQRGKAFRYGHRHSLEGTDLILWFKAESTDPLDVTLTPVEK